MNLRQSKQLSRMFDRVAYSGMVFPVFRAGFALARKFRAEVGSISHFAIDPAILFPQMETVLKEERMTRMNAAAFLCVNSNKHSSSRYNPVKFLHNFLDLYSAKTWQEACKIENIAEGSEDWDRVREIGSGPGKLTSRLEEVKIFCWARDLEIATERTWTDKLLGLGRHIKSYDVYSLLNKHGQKKSLLDFVAATQKNKVSSDLTALPKNEYLPLLRTAMQNGDITETQCAIMLCFILHAQEKRNDGQSYIKHPVEVSNLVRVFGSRYLSDAGQVWKACIAALLHDGGEKTDINLEKDLEGLLPDDVIEAVKCLHKKEGETYFAYLERNASNQLAAMVKLSDIYHNYSDAGANPKAKQAFVYTISANYVEYKLNHPNEHISVADFVKRNNICTEAEFEEISQMAESDAKRRPASEFPHLLKALRNLTPVSEIFINTRDHANTRREENITLHARPDV